MKRNPSQIIFFSLFTLSQIGHAASAFVPVDAGTQARKSALRDSSPALFQLLKSVKGERGRVNELLSRKKFEVEAADSGVRKLFSTLFFDTSTRKDTLPLIEQSLQERSRRTRAVLQASGRIELDTLVIGAGPHGVTAVDELTRRNPELLSNTLVVDQNDGAGGQFRYAGDLFYLNSPDRTETGGVPVVGGNLNRFISWLSSTLFQGRKWPSAGSIAEVTQAALFASPVNVSFRTRVLKAEPASDGRIKVTLGLFEEGRSEPSQRVDVFPQRVIQTSGIGPDKQLFNVDSRLSEEGVFYNLNGALRKFGPYGDHGMQSAIDKTVAVIGFGDSGKVINEFLTRLGPAPAYKNSPAQLGDVKQIVWYVGEKEIETCIDFFRKDRKRYALLLGAISSGRIILVRGKVDAIERSASGKAIIGYESKLEGGAKRGEISYRVQPKAGELSVEDLMKQGEIRKAAFQYDLVISTAGLKSDTASIFPNPGVAATAEGWRIIEGQVGTRGRQAIARESRQISGWYQVGPANETPGTLVEQSETAGATANTVSLFLNAPRTSALAAQVAEQISPSRRDTVRGVLLSYDYALKQEEAAQRADLLGINIAAYLPEMKSVGGHVSEISQPERVLKAEIARLVGRLGLGQTVSLRFRVLGARIFLVVDRVTGSFNPGPSPISSKRIEGNEMLSALLSRYYFGTPSGRLQDVVIQVANEDIVNGTLQVEITRSRST